MDQESLNEMLRIRSLESPEASDPFAKLMLSNSTSRGLTNEGSSPQSIGHNGDRCNSLPDSNIQSGAVIAKIEDIFESMVDCLLGGRNELVISLKSRRTTKDSVTSDSRKISFPGKTQSEAWKFTALLRIIELTHDALVTGITTTKRDMYYKDPELFMKQTVVDRYVDDLAFTLGVPRDALNVVAAAKGLVTGALRVLRQDGVMVDCSFEDEGHLIPWIKVIDQIHVSSARWILVIEKEASFRTLATTRYWEASKIGHGILITAKGYPDIQTRAFVRLLSLQRPRVPVFGLMDFDPDGVAIMSTYKYGSNSLRYQNENLTVPNMRWLGIQSSDICGSVEDDGQGLLQLTKRDRRLAMRMLEKEPFQEETERVWRREVQVMLFLNIKAEIQITTQMGNISEWLDEKLAQRAQFQNID